MASWRSAKNIAPLAVRQARIDSSRGLERFRCGEARWEQVGDAVGEVERNAAVAFAEGIDAAPDDFAGGDEGIEVGGRVAGEASGENLRFEQRGGQRRALQRLDSVEQGVEAATALQNALPVGLEAGEKPRLGGLDFFP